MPVINFLAFVDPGIDPGLVRTQLERHHVDVDRGTATLIKDAGCTVYPAFVCRVHFPSDGQAHARMVALSMAIPEITIRQN